MAEPAVDGVLVVNKPVGPTSHDIVAAARRGLGVSRIGHTGTLDPNASGVLALVVGRATRLAQFLGGRKEYLAEVRFGRRSDTYDAAGVIEDVAGPLPSIPQVEAKLAAFRGTFEQTPPAHSAKKVDGVRAYKRARAAAPVPLRPVPVTVFALDLLEMDGGRARLRVACSAGFYVRALAHDLGAALGTGALLEGLVRTRAGDFTLDTAVEADVLAPDRRADAVLAVQPMDGLLPQMPAAHLTPEGVRRTRHGQALAPDSMAAPLPDGNADVVRLLDPDGRLLGVARRAGPGGILHPSVVLG